MEVELPVLQPEIAKGARRLKTSLGVALGPSTWLPLAEENVRLASECLFHAILLWLFVDRMSIIQTDLFICTGSIRFAAEKNSFGIACVGDIKLSISYDRDEGRWAAVGRSGEPFIKSNLGHLQPLFLLLHKCLFYCFFNIIVTFCIMQVLLDTNMQIFGTVFGQLPTIISIKNGRVETFEAFYIDLLARKAILARCITRILHGFGSALEFVPLQDNGSVRLAAIFALALVTAPEEWPGLRGFLRLQTSQVGAQACRHHDREHQGSKASNRPRVVKLLLLLLLILIASSVFSVFAVVFVGVVVVIAIKFVTFLVGE